MQLLQGATVYAGDRVRIVAAMTGKDPATGQVVPVPFPPDSIVEWGEGQMTSGSNLVFETDVSRFDAIKGTGGPAEVVVLVDKAIQSGPGAVRVVFSCRDPKDPPSYWVTGQCRLVTAPGERPMSNPTPTPTTAKPENVSFVMELVEKPKPPGK